MKITLINSWRQLLSKKINILWLVVALVAAIYSYSYVNNLNIQPQLIIGLVSINNYLPFLILSIIVNIALYRTSTFTMSLQPQQRFTLNIKNWQVTILSILITLVLSLFVFGAPILKLYKFMDLSIWSSFLTILISSNVLIYAFSKNLLGKLLTLIALVGIKFTYTTTMGINIYALICFTVFLITFLTEQTFQVKSSKKINLLWLVKSKFVESIVYILRQTKSLSVYVIYLVLTIYISLPKNLQIQYKIGPLQLSNYLIMLYGLLMFYIALTSIFFQRERNTYVNSYNTKIYVNFYIFNIIYFTILAGVAAVYTNNGFNHIFQFIARNNLSLAVFLTISAIIRKKTTSIILIAFVVAGLSQYALDLYIKNEILFFVATYAVFALSIAIEYFIAQKNKIDFKS